MTFTRIIIVLSIRQAMGTQQTPPNQVLVAIALFLTIFIMSPPLQNSSDFAFLDGLMPDTALVNGANVMKDFLVTTPGSMTL